MPTPAPAIERGRHDKDRRRRALIDAAMHVFAEHGFDAATTREIAGRAGCAEGLIHRYFRGKRGLLLALMEAKYTAVAETFPAASPPGDSVGREVEQILLWQLDVLWQHRQLLRVTVSQAAIDPRIGETSAREANAKRAALIGERLSRHRDAGRLRPDVDVESVAAAIAGVGFHLGFMEQIVFGTPRERVRRMARAAAAAITNGIAAAGAPARDEGAQP